MQSALKRDPGRIIIMISAAFLKGLDLTVGISIDFDLDCLLLTNKKSYF